MISIMIAAIENDTEREFLANLYIDFYDKLRKTALGIVKNENDADEVIQKAFLNLIGNVKTLMCIDKNKLPAYLSTTVRNVAFNYNKRKNMN